MKHDYLHYKNIPGLDDNMPVIHNGWFVDNNRPLVLWHGTTLDPLASMLKNQGVVQLDIYISEPFAYADYDKFAADIQLENWRVFIPSRYPSPQFYYYDWHFNKSVGLSVQQLPAPAYNRQHTFFCAGGNLHLRRALTLAKLLDKNSAISLPVTIFEQSPAEIAEYYPRFNYLCDNLLAISKTEPYIFDSAYGKVTHDQLYSVVANKFLEKDNADLYTACMSAYISVVPETMHKDYTVEYAYISEKTLHPIACMRPFIIVGQQHTLKLVKEYGFKTFSEFWDESYDDIEYWEDRLEAVFELIDYVDSLPQQKLMRLTRAMHTTLNYNRKQLIKLDQNPGVFFPLKKVA